ncbi:maleate isomerase [Robbsia andropogonis]|uniref:maleate cis-trans isomerase family protein n=1 Tax=Robbsia andropogonis TaxID=28092 RepID=UPI0020A1C1D5|nr:aspartate/glutamate racemase family protein [Robbsia andropogonis]MCP1120211.1 aspartate/glutamate racemase family protein [Robbsia andropogonis]MCP1130143.1 aspartate/glutamate racemase family protein [Robbsia andropogonis]
MSANTLSHKTQQNSGAGRPQKIGMLLPSSNPMAEPEIQRMLPPGVNVLTTRLKLAGSTAEALMGMTEKIEEASNLLADAAVDLVVFNCTAVSTFDPSMGEKISGRIADACGIPATTTSEALLAAFEALGTRRIVLITPYIDEVNLREVAFLEHHGYKVLSQVGLGLLEGTGMAAVPPEKWVDLARSHRDDSTDIYFLSCTAINVASVIETLESELGRPVVTSNQAMLWHCLRRLGRNEPIHGLGKLFEMA